MRLPPPWRRQRFLIWFHDGSPTARTLNHGGVYFRIIITLILGPHESLRRSFGARNPCYWRLRGRGGRAHLSRLRRRPFRSISRHGEDIRRDGGGGKGPSGAAARD